MNGHAPDRITFADKSFLSLVPEKVELTLEEVDTLSTLILKKLNSMLKYGVSHEMELLDVPIGDFHLVHRNEAIKLQHLGARLCQLSLSL
jgi:hypothetical protein